MFKFKQTTDVGGDCTACYDVEIDKEYTIKEFIETILKDRKQEWGVFHIYTKGVKKGETKIEYKYGNVLNKVAGGEDRELMQRKVKQVKAHGGWTAMEYYIWIEKNN